MAEEPTIIEKKLLEGYGTVVRWNGLLGVRFSYGGQA